MDFSEAAAVQLPDPLSDSRDVFYDLEESDTQVHHRYHDGDHYEIDNRR